MVFKIVVHLQKLLFVYAIIFLAAGFAFSQEKSLDFVHEVVPILKKHCASCHTNGTYKGSVSFDTRQALIQSKAVVSGDSKKSELLKRITSNDAAERMPPKGPALGEKEVQILARWIDSKLPWDDTFTFKVETYVAPLKYREVKVPPGKGHPIDRILDPYLARQKTGALPLVTDDIFYRRASLDIVGLLPLPEEIESFIASADPQKREKLVESLLNDNRAYTDHWLCFWNDLLRNEYKGTGYIDGGRKQITSWLYNAILTNKPYDQFVRELIKPTPDSEGFIKGIKWRGRVNASQVAELQFSQNISQVFFGVNMKCASCHDSFIDNWKLDDAYALAAIVSDKPLEIYRCDKATGKTAVAGFLWPELGSIDSKLPKDKKLEQLASLVTHPDNGRFSRTMANRIWQKLMGRGIVHPVDMMANKPWNDDLVDYLAGYFKENKYDLKKLIGHITSSRAYQFKAATFAEEPASDNYVFNGPMYKRMTAEQFMDAVWLVTGTAPAKADAPLPKDIPAASGSAKRNMIRAVLVHSNLLMRTLGRPNREQVVTTRAELLTTLEALDLASGSIFHDLVTRGGRQILAELKDKSKDAIIKNVYMRSLGRNPDASELSGASLLLGEKPDADSLADLLWVIFLLPEFQLIS
ncbi:MAG: PSD1 and planctomycete cytochrome C domain-containing protein [Gemmataceae bacterium]